MTKTLGSRWARIAIYYGVALGFSILARVYWRTNDASGVAQGAWGMYWRLIGGVGPFLGAAVVWAAFRLERQITFGGTYPPLGLAMLAVPAIVMGVIGIANPFAVEPHLFGVHLGVWIAIYAVLEETGWRGYLQGEFSHRPALLRYAIVGVFWYAWHLSYLTPHPIGDELLSLGFIILASIGIGFVADRTKSILAAASFHIVGNIMGLTANFKLLIPSLQTRAAIILACVAVWLLMLRLWRMRDIQVQRTINRA
jgi:membrane protease YdiL (CAAX protease family)